MRKKSEEKKIGTLKLENVKSTKKSCFDISTNSSGLHHQLKGRGYDGSKNRSKISERRKNRFFNPCSYGLKILKKPDLTGTQSKPITVLYLLFNSIFMVVMYISLYMGVWAYFLWTHISPERRIPPCEQILQRH